MTCTYTGVDNPAQLPRGLRRGERCRADSHRRRPLHRDSHPIARNALELTASTSIGGRGQKGARRERCGPYFDFSDHTRQIASQKKLRRLSSGGSLAILAVLRPGKKATHASKRGGAASQSFGAVARFSCAKCARCFSRTWNTCSGQLAERDEILNRHAASSPIEIEFGHDFPLPGRATEVDLGPFREDPGNLFRPQYGVGGRIE